MRISIFLVMFAGLQTFALSNFAQNQKFELKLTKVTITEALDKIEDKTDYFFFYNNKNVQLDRIVSVDLKDKTINEILDVLFESTNISYTINNRQIILTGNETTYSVQQDKTVSGKVADSSGAPLPGVTVVVKGTTQGIVTDLDGKYSLTDVPGDATLVFSFVGMKTQEITVAGKTSINITLTEEPIGLEEVVAVGYGTQKKVNLTGAVSAIKSDALESRPVRNTGQALQGLIPGLTFTQSGTGGDLDQTMDFNIRGTGTIGTGSSSSPLVLIDGVEGDMNLLNPQDIENISVLKDAAASAIYGSRAAFGVILINTKKGNKEKVTVTYNNNFNISTPLSLPDQLDSYSFALYWNEGARNDGGTALYSDATIEKIKQYQAGKLTQGTTVYTGTKWEYYLLGNANSDWIDIHFKDHAFSQEHNMSVSGGTDKSQYYFSANYLDQNGIIEWSNDKLKRYSMSLNLTTEISKKIKFNVIERFTRTDYSEPTHQGGLYYFNIYRKYPTIPLYDPNGNLSRASEVPQVQQGGTKKFQTDNHYIQGRLTINPMKGWNIYAEANYKIVNQNIGRTILPCYCYLVDNTPYTEFIALEESYLTSGYTEAYESNEKNHYFSPNIYTDYEFDINKNQRFKVLAGFNAELYKTRYFMAKKSDVILEDYPVLDLAIGDAVVAGDYGHWSTAGFFSRLNYSYKERYLLEMSARYDGSSRFLEDQRWNLFPSLSLGWNITNEPFWNFGDINTMKIRGSYGELGNQNTDDWYPFYQSVNFTTQGGSWLLDGEKQDISSAPGLISTSLTWERIKNWNIGLDMALLKNRLNFSFDYFNRITEDMVGPAIELPVILGTSVPSTNNAKMKSYGFEVEASWRSQIKDFKYSVRAVLTDDQQKILEYPNDTYNISTWYNGKMMNEIWGYTTIGIAKTQDEMDAHLADISQNDLGSGWKAGDIMYADTNNDGEIGAGAGTLNDPGDKKIIGNYTPRYKFSLDFNGSWRNFDFRIFLQGVAKRDYFSTTQLFWGIGANNIWNSLGMTHHLDYFRDENSVMVQAGKMDVNLDSYYPNPYFYTDKNRQLQTRYLLNAAYMRLKNLQIGYTIPQRLTEKIGIASFRCFLSGENLLTFTHLPNYVDPEMLGVGNWGSIGYPMQRVYAIGVNVKF